jgi:hypothetical protein
VLTPAEIPVHRAEKDGKVSYWLQPRGYAKEFREKWGRIGSGLRET